MLPIDVILGIKYMLRDFFFWIIGKHEVFGNNGYTTRLEYRFWAAEQEGEIAPVMNYIRSEALMRHFREAPWTR